MSRTSCEITDFSGVGSLSELPGLAEFPQICRLVQTLPSRLWTPASELPMGWSVFDRAGSVSMVQVLPGITDGDAQMDVWAAAVIASVRTFDGIALVGWTEGYSWSDSDPNSEKSDRFRSRRGPMPGKQETLMVFLQTLSHEYLLNWPIFPGPPRWLGDRRIAAGMTGRFGQLLHKRDLADVGVHAPLGNDPARALRPEPIEQLRRRFAAELGSLPIHDHRVPDLWKHRVGVYDFDSGWRFRFFRCAIGPAVGTGLLAMNHGRPVVISQIERRVMSHLRDLLDGIEFQAEWVKQRSDRFENCGVFSLLLDDALIETVAHRQSPITNPKPEISP